jgi:hypothetical protein
MIQIKQPTQHRPSKDSIKKLLDTRKNGFTAGLLLYPGFFTATSADDDRKKLVYAVMIEVISVVAIITAAYFSDNKNQSIIYAILGALTLFILDFTFAVLLHRRVAIRLYAENLKSLLRPVKVQYKVSDNEVSINKIENTIKDLDKVKKIGETWDLIFKILIIVNGCLKLFLVIQLQLLSQKQAIGYVLFLCLYAWACVIHLKNTGYAWYYILASGSFKKNYKDFSNPLIESADKQNSNLIAEERSIEFKTYKPLQKTTNDSSNEDIIIKGGDERQHYIKINKEFNQNDTKVFSYRLVAKGILKDTDIRDLMNGQDDHSNKDQIAYRCLEHQIKADFCNSPVDETKEKKEEAVVFKRAKEIAIPNFMKF